MKTGKTAIAAITILFISAFSGCAKWKKLDEITISAEGKEFIVELAVQDEEHRTGLMNRKKMAENHGMLFVFDHDKKMSFWMKNTYIPLSIAFISVEGVIKEIHDMKPESEATVYSKYRARYALELNRGAFDRAGINPGDKFVFPSDFKEIVSLKAGKK